MPADPPHSPVCAAQYLRMSTEHQNYSLERQAAANAAYAAARGYEIVRTYADEGISGVTLGRRAGLKALLAEVLGGRADFQVILVHDVSRWGRFQDPDQAAHYEFLCREAGVQVEYCAESFDNDGGLGATLMKQLKRAMAAEFSRDLSVKVGAAQRGLAAKGYWQTGAPGYGLRRMALRPDGTPRAILEWGERNGVQGDRNVLIHGPPGEVAIVRRIYREFVVAGLSWRRIARQLNAEAVPAQGGAAWSGPRVREILFNEKYAGVYVFGRTRERFGIKARRPADEWVRAEAAVEPIISRGLWRLAQQFRRRWKPHVSDEALLAELKTAWRRHGRLSSRIIQADPDTHCPEIYRRRFGGLEGAYARIGYAPPPTMAKRVAMARTLVHLGRQAGPRPSRDAMLVGLRRLLAEHGRISIALIDEDPQLPNASVITAVFGGMRGVYEAIGYAPTLQQQQAAGRRFARRRSDDARPT